jgi:hypothetical protein
MCQSFVILAERGTTRSLAQCEHGTVHLTWDATTLRMRREVLLRLSDLLAQWVEQPDQSLTWAKVVQLFVTPEGGCCLWIGHHGIALSHTAALSFVELVREAATMLNTARMAPASPLSVGYCRMLVTEPYAYADN